VRFRDNVLPVQGTTNPSATWRLQSEINNTGAWTDRVTVDSSGVLTLGTFPASIVMGNATIFGATNGPRFQVSSSDIFGLRGGVGLNIAQARSLGWSSNASDSTEAPDLLLSRRAAASLQFGADSATPIAQTLGVAAGVGTNIAGASFTIAAGRGTGTGTPGTLLFQTSTAIGSGSTAQTLATRMTLNATDLVMASGIGIQLGNAAVAAVPAATHTVTIKDSTGTTYRLLCVV
jgi:hypothetical protein